MTRTARYALSVDALNLFLELAQDALKWNSMPPCDGTGFMRRNMDLLVKKGLLERFQDSEGETWALFTEAGVKFASSHGINHIEILAENS